MRAVVPEANGRTLTFVSHPATRGAGPQVHHNGSGADISVVRPPPGARHQPSTELRPAPPVGACKRRPAVKNWSARNPVFTGTTPYVKVSPTMSRHFSGSLTIHPIVPPFAAQVIRACVILPWPRLQWRGLGGKSLVALWAERSGYLFTPATQYYATGDLP